MFKKKCILIFCLCFSMVMLAGCVDVVELTTEEQDKIAEYSAGVLLQHYGKYRRRLIKQEETVPQQTGMPTVATPVPTEVPENQQDSASEPEEGKEEDVANEISLNDLYHVKGMNVSYDSYVVCKEYPKNSEAFKLTAKEGQRLLVVQFKLKNTTSKPLKVKLTKRKIDYSMDVDGSLYKPVVAIQENGGMNYLSTKLKPGSSESAILVFEIPKEAEKFGAAVLTVKDGENASTVQLKQ